MAVSSPVKFFHSSMPGAPSLLPQWGSLTSMLDSVLVNGFGLVSVDSITVSGGVATAAVAAGHVFQVDQVVLIGGATQALMNGEFKVTARTATSFQFAAPTGAPSTVGGTLSAKVSPLGFEIAFTGTNKRAYRTKNVESPRNLLLVNDGVKTPDYDTNWAKWANVGIVSAMSDIDTVTGIQAPFDASRPNYNWQQYESNQWGWHKWYFGRTPGYDSGGDNGGSGRNWVIIGDDRFFYFFTTWSGAGSQYFYGRAQYSFGDITTYRPGDQTHTALCADDQANSNEYINYPGIKNDYGIAANGFQGKVLLRSHTQVGAPIRWAAFGSFSPVSGYSQPPTIPFPNAADYSLILMPMLCRQEDNNIRGEMPGVLWVPHNRPYPDLTVVENIASLPGRKVALVNSQYSNDPNGAMLAFDITGPWR